MAATTRSPSSEATLALMLELGFVGVATVIGGASSEIGKWVLTFMGGLMVVYLITHPDIIDKFAAASKNITGAAGQ